jgi:hypothetical protein
MKYSLDTNVIISHFKADKFSDEQYGDIFVTWNPSDYDINIAVNRIFIIQGRSKRSQHKPNTVFTA